jgi:hypothetical protein
MGCGGAAQGNLVGGDVDFHCWFSLGLAATRRMVRWWRRKVNLVSRRLIMR